MLKRIFYIKRRIFAKVKLLILDVDGVLTRGDIIYDDQERQIKVFNVKDGLGMFILGKMGIPAVIVTARDSGSLRRRAQDMGIAEVYAGIMPKDALLPRIENTYGVTRDAICFVGDDLIDIGLMRQVGVSVAVADAVPEVRAVASYVTKRRGGHGAVREVVELILKAKKRWKEAQNFFSSLPHTSAGGMQPQP